MMWVLELAPVSYIYLVLIILLLFRCLCDGAAEARAGLAGGRSGDSVPPGAAIVLARASRGRRHRGPVPPVGPAPDRGLRAG